MVSIRKERESDRANARPINRARQWNTGHGTHDRAHLETVQMRFHAWENPHKELHPNHYSCKHACAKRALDLSEEPDCHVLAQGVLRSIISRIEASLVIHSRVGINKDLLQIVAEPPIAV